MEVTSLLIGAFIGAVTTTSFVLLNRSKSKPTEVTPEKPQQNDTAQQILSLGKMVETSNATTQKALVLQQDTLKDILQTYKPKAEPPKKINLPPLQNSEEEEFVICWDQYPEY